MADCVSATAFTLVCDGKRRLGEAANFCDGFRQLRVVGEIGDVSSIAHWGAGDSTIRACSFAQTGAQAFRQDARSLTDRRLVRTICTAGGSKIRSGIGRLRKRPEREQWTHPPVFSRKGGPFVRGYDEKCWAVRRAKAGGYRMRDRRSVEDRRATRHHPC